MKGLPSTPIAVNVCILGFATGGALSDSCAATTDVPLGCSLEGCTSGVVGAAGEAGADCAATASIGAADGVGAGLRGWIRTVGRRMISGSSTGSCATERAGACACGATAIGCAAAGAGSCEAGAGATIAGIGAPVFFSSKTLKAS